MTKRRGPGGPSRVPELAPPGSTAGLFALPRVAAAAAFLVVLAGPLPARDDTAAEMALARFRVSYARPDAAARAAAVTELGRTPHEKTAARIAALLTGDAKEVRVAAAKSLASFSDYKKLATPALVAALDVNARNPDVRVAILETIAKLRDPAARATVNRGVRESNFRVAVAAVRAAGGMGDPTSLDALHGLLRDLAAWIAAGRGGGYVDDAGAAFDEKSRASRLAELQKEVIKAFQTITGEKWGSSKEWLFWYEKRRAAFKKPD